MKPSVVTWSCLQWRAVFVYEPYSADGGKHLIFKIQATSFSSGHNNSLQKKKKITFLPKGFLPPPAQRSILVSCMENPCILLALGYLFSRTLLNLSLSA